MEVRTLAPSRFGIRCQLKNELQLQAMLLPIELQLKERKLRILWVRALILADSAVLQLCDTFNVASMNTSIACYELVHCAEVFVLF